MGKIEKAITEEPQPPLPLNGIADGVIDETWDEMVERIIRKQREERLKRDFELLSIEADYATV